MKPGLNTIGPRCARLRFWAAGLARRAGDTGSRGESFAGLPPPPAAMAGAVLLVGLVLGSASVADDISVEHPADSAVVPVAGKPLMPQPRRERLAAISEEPAANVAFLTTDQLRQLGPLSFTGTNTPLRQSLANLSRTLRLAILLDRRVDPERIIDFDLANITLAEALEKISDRSGIGATLLGPVAYFGPSGTARDLRTLAALRTQEAQRLPARAKAAALVARPLKWGALSSPRDIIAGLAAEAVFEIRGLEQVPHDLMAGANLPALPWVDRLTLFAAQFGLTFEFSRDGRIVTLVPISDDVKIERTYPAARDAAKTVAAWQQLAPQADIKLDQRRITVRGRIEDHERISPPRAGTGGAPGKNVAGKQVHTLKMDNVPLDAFLDALGEKLSLSIDLDRTAMATSGIKPSVPVSVDVQNASLDELLRAALDPVGLTFTRKDKKVNVTPK